MCSYYLNQGGVCDSNFCSLIYSFVNIFSLATLGHNNIYLHVLKQVTILIRNRAYHPTEFR